MTQSQLNMIEAKVMELWPIQDYETRKTYCAGKAQMKNFRDAARRQLTALVNAGKDVSHLRYARELFDMYNELK